MRSRDEAPKRLRKISLTFLSVGRLTGGLGSNGSSAHLPSSRSCLRVSRSRTGQDRWSGLLPPHLCTRARPSTSLMFGTLAPTPLPPSRPASEGSAYGRFRHGWRGRLRRPGQAFSARARKGGGGEGLPSPPLMWISDISIAQRRRSHVVQLKRFEGNPILTPTPRDEVVAISPSFQQHRLAGRLPRRRDRRRWLGREGRGPPRSGPRLPEEAPGAWLHGRTSPGSARSRVAPSCSSGLRM